MIGGEIIFGIGERRGFMVGECAMNLRPKLDRAWRIRGETMRMTKRVSLPVLLFIIRWLGGALLLDENLET